MTRRPEEKALVLVAGNAGGGKPFHFQAALHRMRPNPSIERTSSGKLRLPPAAAHVQR